MGVSKVMISALFIFSSINSIAGYLEFSLDSSNVQWTLNNDKLGMNIHVDAKVPGGVYTDLADAGVIVPVDELYYRFNDVNTRWVAYENWNYSARFELNASMTPSGSADDSLILDCKGLDTAARLSINGHHLGSADNMFTRYKVSVCYLYASQNCRRNTMRKRHFVGTLQLYAHCIYMQCAV